MDADHRPELGGRGIGPGLLDEAQDNAEDHHEQHDAPARKSPVRNEEAASTSEQDHERIDQGFAEQLDAGMALRPGRRHSDHILATAARLLPPKGRLSTCAVSPTPLRLPRPAASSSSGETRMAADGWWGPWRIRLGSTGVGKAGIDSPGFAGVKKTQTFLEGRLVIR